MAQIRPIDPSDVDRCIDLSVEALQPVFASFRLTYGNDLFDRMHPGWETEQADSIKAMCASADARTWVAETESRIVGVASASIGADTGLGSMDFLAVAKQEQRHGIGSALSMHLLADSKTSGMSFATAYARDHDGHRPIRSLLTRLGFSPLQVQPRTLLVGLAQFTRPEAEFDPTIRDMTPGDIEECIRFGIEAFRPVFASFETAYGPDLFARLRPEWETAQADYIRTSCAQKSTLVAVIDNQPIGFVVLDPRVFTGIGAIELLAVSPDFAGRGVGTILNIAALDRFAANGMEYAIVSTGSDPGHAAARRAYKKVGFSPAPVHWHLMATKL